MTCLQKAKLYLRLNTNEPHEDDSVLELLLENAATKVMNYCNRQALPVALEPVVMDIALENYSSYMNMKSGAPQGNVTSIKRGDTQINYSSENYNILTGAGGAEFSKNHIKQLNTFRRMKV